MKNLIVILISSLQLCYGFTPIEKGQPAPDNGYFVTSEEEYQVRDKLEKAKRKNLVLSDLAAEQKDYIKTLKEHNKELREVSKDTGLISKPMYFVIGGVSVSILAVGLIKLIK